MRMNGHRRELISMTWKANLVVKVNKRKGVFQSKNRKKKNSSVHEII